MSKPALFIIDMLNDCFIHQPLIEQREELCQRINSLIDFARENQFHIIWVRQEFDKDLSDAFLEMREEQIDMYIQGTAGPALLDELKPQAGDHEIIKKRYSMFFKTNLEVLLEQLGPSSLILAGVNTHACIRMAAIDAYQRDLRAVVIRDCVASPDKEHHEVTLKYLEYRISKVVTLDEFKNEFQGWAA